MNYIGGKFKLLPQLFPLFPAEIGTFVDLFAGGGDVFINARAERVVANDINYHVIDIYKRFQSQPVEATIEQIESTIKKWDLSQTNEDAYRHFRAYYNSCKEKDPIDLYTLVCHSFNYQFRFNSKHEFNNPFGKNRSWFNPTLRANLIRFINRLGGIEFSSQNFKRLDLSYLHRGDFLYADPPYLITTGSYNDGKRGFEGWQGIDDLDLYNLLDELNQNGVKFALSNVLEHKGKTNIILDEWRQAYHTHFISKDYNNSNYQSKNKDKRTCEILVTNYITYGNI